jgi:hypothetical protein
MLNFNHKSAKKKFAIFSNIQNLSISRDLLQFKSYFNIWSLQMHKQFECNIENDINIYIFLSFARDKYRIITF